MKHILDVDAMINTVENEKRDDPKYFQEILVAAVVIATRIIQDNFDEFRSFCSFLLEWTLRKNRPETAFYISKAMEKLFRKNQDFNYAVSLYYLGFSYFDLEKFSDAKEELLKCNEMLKEESILNQSNDLKIKVMDLLGRCYYDLGVFDESENALKEALELKKKDEFPESWLIPTLINLSKAQAEMNKFNEALENANLALDLDEPDGSQETLGNRDQIGIVNRGRRYMQMENFPKAIEDFQKVDVTYESEIHKAALQSYLGYCYLALGQIEPALFLHKNALEIYKE
jgi:tetratricopeptide (TPR) repeat protein